MRPVAVVTGSSGGIGRAVARAFRDAGHAVVTNGRSARKGPGDLHVRADASTAAGVRKLVAAAKRAFGRIDVLVCCVGDYAETPLGRMDVEAWRSLFESNLWSAVLCVREALPLLRRRGGSVVTLGTPLAHVARARPRIAAYQMAKTALAVFTKSLAQAEAKRGVRANMVSPGYVRTEGTSRKELASLPGKVPAGRLGTPEEVAGVVVWLAGDAARYVTGAVVDVGGGVLV